MSQSRLSTTTLPMPDLERSLAPASKSPDLSCLYDENYGVKLLTLRQVNGKTYQIVSRQLLESASDWRTATKKGCASYG